MDVLHDACNGGWSITQDLYKYERHLPLRYFNSYILPKARLFEAFQSFIARVNTKKQVEGHGQDQEDLPRVSVPLKVP